MTLDDLPPRKSGVTVSGIRLWGIELCSLEASHRCHLDDAYAIEVETTMVISFDKTICSDLQAATSREWLETNGIGGYASSTICGMNRRCYHGLLVSATKPPVGRMVLLSNIAEALVFGDRRVELGTNTYTGAIHPEGYRHQTGFRLDPFKVRQPASP